MVEPQLVDAAIRVLATDGWDGLTLERVAGEAGSSRTTLWRQGITRESLVEALLGRLSADYRDAVWPALTGDGTGAERLRLALEALCDVADRNLALLAASDTAFHEAAEPRHARPTSALAPIRRLLQDGKDDGSLAFEEPAPELATVVFNTVCWTYVHLRERHGWQPRRARRTLIDVLLRGLSR
jgi:AcrR family transcriptional regulator